MAIVESCIAIFVSINILFYWANQENNYSLIDIGWGLFFIVIAACTQFIKIHIQFYNVVIFLMIFLWGARLTIFLFSRNHKKPEDPRYTKIKNQWSGNIKINAYFRIFILQGLLALIISIPLYPLNQISDFQFDNIFYVGFTLWLIGLIFESIADNQKSSFKKVNSNSLCKIGLWKYSRHPNYFGEVLLWWGFWISISNKTPWWTIIGPSLITYLILKISGIPMSEESRKNDPEFIKYKSETNAFFPWCPKKSQ